MNKSTLFLKSLLTSASAVLILFELPDFIYTSAMAEQEISTLSKAIFIPLFVICAIASLIISYKKLKTNIQDVGFIFMGAIIILLAFLNIYNLQMLLPLLKTNSVSLVVMWVGRILGGLTGAFCGLAVGPLLKKDSLPYIGILLGGVLTYIICFLCPDIIPYEIVFYAIGFLVLIVEMISVLSGHSKVLNK